MKYLHKIAFILVIIGGVNWGLVAIDPSWDLVKMILGGTMLDKLVYALVGVSAIYIAVTHKAQCADCKA